MDAAVATRSVRIALVGVPNCGKTALFNRLTGSRQKVANYPGVTVERREGERRAADGSEMRVLDLPGTYSLNPTTLDEAITRDVLLGRVAGESSPDLVVCVVDSVHLPIGLRLALEVKRLGLPMVLALNRMDVAKKRGVHIDLAVLAKELGVAVLPTIAVKSGGADALIEAIEPRQWHSLRTGGTAAWSAPSAEQAEQTQNDLRGLLQSVGYRAPPDNRLGERLDGLLMHPIWGMLVLAGVMFLMFQAVFSWAEAPMDLIDRGMAALGAWVGGALPQGPLNSLLVDGVIAGAGGVLVFLPQIIILFFFILALEDSGYLPRAAYLLDRLMGGVGLSGRAFIPLLSSFACAIPGIMAARTIPSWRDRLTTIMIAPLMTCSARLPVYALLIAAFIPDHSVGPFNLQGLVMFALYAAGVLSALLVAWVTKLFAGARRYSPLMLELPDYQWPNASNLLLGLWERVKIFLSRVGGIILALTIILWFLSSYPAPPEGASGAPIQYSFAGRLGAALEYVFAPIGFNWQISIALVPGLAAREVAVSALGTVYALSAPGGDDVSGQLEPLIAHTWSLATACSLLAWYVFAPQCLSTLAVVKRETNSWRYPLIMAGYLFALAYLASFVTFRVVSGWT
ncbi:MAG TPA: ferrous iron transporter B [Steroidobacteraceae bacterium]|nr:ferrous iron transporter B [Steroidobacteraceae bacterium]